MAMPCMDALLDLCICYSCIYDKRLYPISYARITSVSRRNIEIISPNVDFLVIVYLQNIGIIFYFVCMFLIIDTAGIIPDYSHRRCLLCRKDRSKYPILPWNACMCWNNSDMTNIPYGEISIQNSLAS